MYDELTSVDIKKMEEEILYRESVLGPELLAEMKQTADQSRAVFFSKQD